MPSLRNQQLLQETKEKVGKAQAMFFVEYQGLTHKQLEEARKELKDNNSEVAVTKNTLINIALQERNVDAKDRLTGAFATLFSYEDPVKTAKILQTFFKKYQLPKIKFGVYNGTILDEAEILKLASLPSKDVLIGKFVGLLKSPITGLVYNLKWNISKLVFTLKAIEDKKGKAN